MKNRLLWISTALFIISTPAMAGNETAEDQLKQAKAAYANGNCVDAVAGFKIYLKSADPGQKKRQSIEAALAWCEKTIRKNDLLARKRIEFIGVGSTRPSENEFDGGIKPPVFVPILPVIPAEPAAGAALPPPQEGVPPPVQ